MRRIVGVSVVVLTLIGCGFLLSAVAALNSPADGDVVGHALAFVAPFVIGAAILSGTGYGLWRVYAAPRRRPARRRSAGYRAPRRPAPTPRPRPPTPGLPRLTPGPAPTLARLKALTPTQFEEFVRILVEHDGYLNVQRVGGAGDEGIDIRMHDATGALWVIQCKRYQKNVAPDMVREFYGAMVHSQAQRGYLITTGSVSDNARSWIGDKDLYILDGADLVHYAEQRLGHNLHAVLTQISYLA